jgi:hypothetical protein
MFDLLVPTSLDQLFLIIKIFFTFSTKELALMRRCTVLILPSQLVFPAGVFRINQLPIYVARWQHGFRQVISHKN